MRKTCFIRLVAGVIVLVAVGKNAAQTSSGTAGELLTNGQLGDTGGTFASPRGDGAWGLEPGSVIIPGWTTVKAELAWITNGSFGLTAPSGTGFFLDLSGYRDNAPYGGITQRVPTTVGKTYTLSFSLGAFQSNARYRGPLSAAASAGDLTNNFMTATPALDATGSVWERFTWDFTAGSTETPITIVGSSAAGGGYLGLADISLAEPGLRISSASVSGKDLRVSFVSENGRGYVIESSESLTPESWSAFAGSSVSGNGQSLASVLTNVVTKRFEFYRIKATP